MNPDAPARPEGFALVLHSLAPTAGTLVAYIVTGFTITIIHLVALGVSGTAYPENLDDELLMGYANFIIQPLLVFVNHSFVNSAFTLVAWALIGSVAAALIGTAANALNDWRNTRSDVSMPRYGVVIQHPLQHNLVTRMLWQLVVGAAIAAYTIFALLAVRHCFASDLSILSSASPGEVALRIGYSVGIWTALFHGYVILLRLFVRRTRIFGEILY